MKASKQTNRKTHLIRTGILRIFNYVSLLLILILFHQHYLFVCFLFLSPFFASADHPDADADEEEGHIPNENEKEINKDKERIEDDTLSDEQGSPDQPNNEISISLLRAKNLSLLQSQ